MRIGTQRFPEKQSKKSLYKKAHPVSGDTLVDIRGSWTTSSKWQYLFKSYFQLVPVTVDCR